MRCLLCALMYAAACLASTQAAAQGEYPRPQLLLEPAELAKPDVARQFVVLDARSSESYDQGHIANAHWVDVNAWKAAFGEGQDAAGWSKRIGDLGIGTGSKVVIYDASASNDAARIWWTLRYWGIEDARLLNGGWKAWQAAKLPTTDEEPRQLEPVAFVAQARAKQLLVKDQVLKLLENHQRQIIDSRSSEEFCGLDPKDNKRAGAIPGAKHLDWVNLIDRETDRFKNAQELSRIFDEAGIDVNAPSVSHCQSGGRASVMVFALELMGANDAANYYRGWSEWGNAEDTSIRAVEGVRVLYDFTADDAAKDWVTVNDGVMGGVSEGRVRIAESGTLLFDGTLSLENNGGFASVRSRPKALGLADGESIVTRVRGDGREYFLNLYVPTSRVAFSYRAPLKTKPGQWIVVAVPLKDFVATSFGRIVENAGPVDAGTVNSLGFLLSDKKPGAFKLEVQWIKAAPDMASE